MPRILTAEEKQARLAADQAKCDELAKILENKKVKIDKVRRYDRNYLQRLVNANSDKSVKQSSVKEVKATVKKNGTNGHAPTNGHDFDPDAFKKEMINELRGILKENHINLNGNGHAKAPEPAPAQADTKPSADFGKSDFYKALENTKTEHIPFTQAPPNPAKEEPAKQPSPGAQEPEPEKEKEDPEVIFAEVVEDPVTPIDWDDKDVEALIDLWPELQAAITNAVFMGINVFFPEFNRQIQVEDIGQMSEFRRKMIRPGLKVILSKVGAPSDNPDYILLVLAAFVAIDAFMYSSPIDPNNNES